MAGEHKRIMIMIEDGRLQKAKERSQIFIEIAIQPERPIWARLKKEGSCACRVYATAWGSVVLRKGASSEI